MSSDEVCNGKRKRSTDESAKGLSTEAVGSSTTGSSTTCNNNKSGDADDDKWSEELHRMFVAAIYDAGVSQSSPSVILENMGSDRPASLTSERVKSHLQKYRKNKAKSKEDFQRDYDSFIGKALTVSGAGANGNNSGHAIMPPSSMIEMMGGGKPSGGDIAAFLSYSVMTEGEANSKNASNNNATTISSIGIAKESQDYLKIFAGTHVPFPQLTEEEKRSPLGVSMCYVMGLFSSLSQHMLQERRKGVRPLTNDSATLQEPTANAPVNASSTTTGSTAAVVVTSGEEKSIISGNQQQQVSNNDLPWPSSATGTTGMSAISIPPLHLMPGGPVVKGNGPNVSGQPGSSAGLFYPTGMQSKPESDATQQVATSNNGQWNAAMHHHQASISVPAYEARELQSTSHGRTANSMEAPSRSGSTHSRDGGGGRGPGSYEQA